MVYICTHGTLPCGLGLHTATAAIVLTAAAAAAAVVVVVVVVVQAAAVVIVRMGHWLGMRASPKYFKLLFSPQHTLTQTAG